MNLTRTLRTPSSERFILHSDSGKDVAALDLHYLDQGRVAGTLIILDSSAISENKVPEALREIDEKLLPDASIEDGKVSFTVVSGHVVGNFVPHPH